MSRGDAWISTDPTPPAPTDGKFGDGWTKIGEVDTSMEAEAWKVIRAATSGGNAPKSVRFYLSVTRSPETFPTLADPAGFWLGVDGLGTAAGDGLVITTKRVVVDSRIRRRKPERHPGRMDIVDFVPVYAKAATGRAVFERVG